MKKLLRSNYERFIFRLIHFKFFWSRQSVWNLFYKECVEHYTSAGHIEMVYVPVCEAHEDRYELRWAGEYAPTPCPETWMLLATLKDIQNWREFTGETKFVFWALGLILNRVSV